MSDVDCTNVNDVSDVAYVDSLCGASFVHICRIIFNVGASRASSSNAATGDAELETAWGKAGHD
jgi:hypothetical protein